MDNERNDLYGEHTVEELIEHFKNMKVSTEHEWEKMEGRYSQSWNLLETVDLTSKYKRGKGFNWKEKGTFSGICGLGDASLIECYGRYSEGREMSAHDICVVCSKCRYYNQAKNDLIGRGLFDPNRHSIARTDFLEDRFEESIDHINPKAYVYFITDGQYIKIGKATDIKSRLDSMQTGNAKKLTLMYAVPLKSDRAATEVEGYLHLVYRFYRVRGEWFNIKWLIETEDWKRTFDARYVEGFSETA